VSIFSSGRGGAHSKMRIDFAPQAEYVSILVYSKREFPISIFK